MPLLPPLESRMTVASPTLVYPSSLHALLASPVLLAIATPLVVDEPATLAAELAEDMLLDAADIAVDMVAVPVAVPVAVELLTAVAAAQEAAVGRFVTPAGMQMLSAYLIVAIVKCENDLFPLRNIIAHPLGPLCRKPLRRSMLLL
jgi:hypothetical protein